MNEDKIDIGDEVLCVDSSVTPESAAAIARMFPVWIKEGDKYIVREVFFNNDIAPGILLQNRKNPEVYIPLLKRHQEPAFAIWRFVKERTAYQIAEQEKENKQETVIEEVIKTGLDNMLKNMVDMEKWYEETDYKVFGVPKELLK